MSEQPGETVTCSTPTRRWWRKRRWIFAGLLWLVVAYLSSSGPVSYLEGRQWLSRSTARAYNRPFVFLARHVPFLESVYSPYTSWWYQQGFRYRIFEVSSKGPDLEILLRHNGLDAEGGGAASGTAVNGRTQFRRITLFGLHESAGHELVIQNGRQTPDGTWVWDHPAPVQWDGRQIATVPAGTKKIVVEYLDGEFSIEADGKQIDIEQVDIE